MDCILPIITAFSESLNSNCYIVTSEISKKQLDILPSRHKPAKFVKRTICLRCKPAKFRKCTAMVYCAMEPNELDNETVLRLNTPAHHNNFSVFLSLDSLIFKSDTFRLKLY